MTKSRLEAFSDGVIAIIITIMVLELHVPHGGDWKAFLAMSRELILYALSFLLVGIYWNNHHHLLHATSRINGAILWANQHLLFWLSLVPFTTRWVSEQHLSALPTAAYGLVLLMSAIAYTILTMAIVRHEGPDSKLAIAVGKDVKGKISLVAYLLAVPAAFWHPWISVGIFILVAFLWLVPDRRIETRLEH